MSGKAAHIPEFAGKSYYFSCRWDEYDKHARDAMVVGIVQHAMARAESKPVVKVDESLAARNKVRFRLRIEAPMCHCVRCTVVDFCSGLGRTLDSLGLGCASLFG